MIYDVVIVGGGIAGLTSAAYLSKHGYKVLLCEKQNKVGGLINSFKYKDFTFDGGMRALENSGVLLPMLKQLGIEVEFVKNNVSMGIEKDVIKLSSKDSLKDYKDLLIKKFPEDKNDIIKITQEISDIMDYMDVLYGVDNPILLELKNDKEYLGKTILPWMPKFLKTLNKISKLNTPVNEHLRKFTKNEALIDMITQHFFTNTPTFFALGYFDLYIDYIYPKGGTGVLIEKMESFIRDNNGEIKKETEISHIDIENKRIKDKNGIGYRYNKLIWASDLKALYNNINLENISNKKIAEKIKEFKNKIKYKKGGDSILTLYLTVDLDPSYFKKICTEHFFYTPCKKGLNTLYLNEEPIIKSDKEDIMNWAKDYFALTTYEISIPALKDISLVPEGKTGVIISTLIDYSVIKYIESSKWYEEFKSLSEKSIINVLNNTIFKNFSHLIKDKIVSTPLTIENITGNTDGAITGWAFTNDSIPVENKMANILKSVDTVIPDVYQAGQWSFSPSGLPISILTGKIAADKAEKTLKK